jgi:hypothetical protein
MGAGNGRAGGGNGRGRGSVGEHVRHARIKTSGSNSKFVETIPGSEILVSSDSEIIESVCPRSLFIKLENADRDPRIVNRDQNDMRSTVL